MKKVAIVGFSLQSLEGLENSDADEYWTMNHIIFVNWLKIPRIDRLFEIHKRDWYLRGEVGKAQQYDEWLREKHEFPIIMQESELNPSLVPSGVMYPIDDICKTLTPNLVRRVGTKEVMQRYFTSTAAFMFAYAIYLGFDEIQLHGIDMDSDTEYGYQRPCGEFWLGVATGRGIKVVIPEKSAICNAPLYGYDIVPFIDKLYVKNYIEFYQKQRIKHKERMDRAAIKLNKNPDNQRNVDNYLKESAWVYMHDGAISAGGRLININDSYISRQALEMKRAEYLNGMEYCKAQVNNLKGRIDLLGREQIPDEDWRSYLNYRANMFANHGALQLHNKLTRIIDFRDVVPELKMEIMEDSEVK